MIRSARRMLLVGALAWIAGVGVAVAAIPVANVTLEKGQIKIRHQGQSHIYRHAGEQVPLELGDAVHAGAEGYALVRFEQGGDTVRLYPQSRFEISEATRDKVRVGLSIGKLFAIVLSRLRENAVTVKTPTAVIGVKGTEFVAGTDGEKTFALTISGVVSLRTDVLPELEQALRANEASFASRFRTPTPATPVSEAQRDKIVAQSGLAAFQEVRYAGEAGAIQRLDEGTRALDKVGQSLETSGTGGTGSVVFDVRFE